MLHNAKNNLGESIDSSFYLDPNLFNTLPIHFKPFEDESTKSWVHRLAHANCMHPNALFSSDKKRGYYQWYDNLIGSSLYNLISASKYKNGLFFPDRVSDFYYHEFVTMGFFQYVGYCPYCLRDSETIYSKLKWEYRWNTHCEKHHMRLSNKCVHCDEDAPIYSNADEFPWRKTWGICQNCKQSLAAKPEQEPKFPHPITRKYHSKKLTQINQLVENTVAQNKDTYHLSLLIFLADFLECDRQYKIKHTYQVLLDNGMDPMTYVCCEWPELYLGRRLIKSVPYDSAMMMAWHILGNRMDIFYALMDDDWIPDFFPDPNTKEWTPKHIAKKTFPRELFNAYIIAQRYSWDFHTILGTQAKSRHLFCIHMMYTYNQSSREILLKVIDRMANGSRSLKQINILKRYFRSACNKI